MYDPNELMYPGPEGPPQQAQLPPDVLDPWTSADQNWLRELTGGLGQIRKQVAGGVLSPQEGMQMAQQIDALRLPQLARQHQAKQARKNEMMGQVMEQAALGEAVQAQHALSRAQAFPQTVTEFRDLVSGKVAHFYQETPGKWAQIDFGQNDAQPEPGGGEVMPPGQGDASGDDAARAAVASYGSGLQGAIGRALGALAPMAGGGGGAPDEEGTISQEEYRARVGRTGPAPERKPYENRLLNAAQAVGEGVAGTARVLGEGVRSTLGPVVGALGEAGARAETAGTKKPSALTEEAAPGARPQGAQIRGAPPPAEEVTVEAPQQAAPADQEARTKALAAYWGMTPEAYQKMQDARVQWFASGAGVTGRPRPAPAVQDINLIRQRQAAEEDRLLEHIQNVAELTGLEPELVAPAVRGEVEKLQSRKSEQALKEFDQIKAQDAAEKKQEEIYKLTGYPAERMEAAKEADRRLGPYRSQLPYGPVTRQQLAQEDARRAAYQQRFAALQTHILDQMVKGRRQQEVDARMLKMQGTAEASKEKRANDARLEQDRLKHQYDFQKHLATEGSKFLQAWDKDVANKKKTPEERQAALKGHLQTVKNALGEIGYPGAEGTKGALIQKAIQNAKNGHVESQQTLAAMGIDWRK